MATETNVSELINDDGDLDQAAAEALIDQYNAAESKDDADDSDAPGDDEPTPAADDDSAKPKPDEAKGKGEEVSSDDESADWMKSSDVRDIIESLSMSPEDLMDFEDAEDFQRFIERHDKQLRRDGQRKPAEQQQKPDESSEKPAEKPAEKEQQQEERARDDKGRFLPADRQPFNVTLNPEIHDEEIVQNVKGLQDHFHKRLAVLEAELESARARQVVEARTAMLDKFDMLVDGLDHGDLFGKSGELTQEQHAARAKLWEEMVLLTQGHAVNGKPLALNRGTVMRALNLGFAEQLRTKDRKSFVDRLRKQSGKRLGSPGQRANKRPYNGPPENDPELHAMYHRFEEENGGRT